MSSDTLYVFGDQSAESLSSIRQLYQRSRHCEPLRSFLRGATDKIQQALARIPAHTRPVCSPFDSVLQLAETVDTENDSAAFVSALLSISQLGEFILHLSSNPRALESTNNPVFFGICTGSFAAAAAASCRNLTEFLQISPQIVTIAFQLGFEATNRSWLLEQSHQSWVTVVKNVNTQDIEKAVGEFNTQRCKNHSKKAYISVTGQNSATISGPPSTLERLFRGSQILLTSRRHQLPITAAYHASHLPRIPDSRIFDHVDDNILRRSLSHILVSPRSGQAYESLDLKEILYEIALEVLQIPIDWQIATAGLPKLFTRSAALYPMGPVSAIKAIRQVLSSHEPEEQPLQHPAVDSSTARHGSGAIAIVGMSVRLPGSETLEDLWRVLEEGRDLHEKIRADRFDWKTHFDPTGKLKNATMTPYGVFVDRPGYFDPKFFNMSPREALQTDPQQRMMLLTTYEALENSGYSPNRTPSTNTRRIASFIGQTGDDYREVNAGQDIGTYFITGGIRAFGPGRINYHFGWEGPSFSLDTACSSSAGSIQLACSALLARECDTAIGGGANLLTTPDLFAGLSRGSFLSKTGGCKTFDQDADGYVRADGCGVLVLKRLEDALADRDNIVGVIRGAVTNHSAEAVSITHPHDLTQQRLFRAVLNEAGILPHEVDYAELHGTGTQAGDAVESRSVTSVLCHGRNSSNPLYIGTVKPNLGHGEAASGVTSIIKAVLMMQKDIIPPHVGIKGRMNQKLPSFKDLNVRISSKNTPFLPRTNGDGKRRILVNNFDAAGGNTSLLIEDPPKVSTQGTDPRSHQIVALSAKSTSSITNNARHLVQHLKQNPELRLEDIAYTTTARRMHHPVRTAYAVTSCEELITAIEKQILSEEQKSKIRTNASVVMCFSGQGSQYVSMGSTLYQDIPAFRRMIDDYAEICVSHGHETFLPIITGDAAGLESPVLTQLAVVSVELALVQLWKSWGVQPKAVIGHSLGEYAALCCAGVLSPSDCLYLVGQRASLMLSKCTKGTHAMLAVQTCAETMQDLIEEQQLENCNIACLNAPNSVAVSGLVAEIDILYERLEDENFKATKLEVPFAFHSSQLDEVLEDYACIASKVDFMKPQIPVASTLLGEVVDSDGIFNAQYLKRQARDVVRFQEALMSMEEAAVVDGKTIFVEVGPHPVLLSMVKTTLSGNYTMLPSLKRNESEWKVLASSLASIYSAGLDVNWSQYHQPFEKSLKMTQLPNYSFDLKNYWMQYEGDWALRKGKQAETADPNKNNAAAAPSFSTTSLHTIEKESIGEDEAEVVFTSRADEPILNRALRGHLVNGAGLCPSSVYAEMAFTAAKYIHKKVHGSTNISMDVCNMEVHKPLIIKPESTDQLIRVTAALKKVTQEMTVKYSSQDGQKISEHAHCTVRIGDGEEWQTEWTRHAYMVRDRMNNLVQGSQNGNVHKILRPMAYKLFAALVDYDERYQGMEEVYLDSALSEATANVKFQTNEGNFTYSPYWIDGITHLSGFVLNGSDRTPADSVFISHGWKSMRFVGSMSAEKSYRSYVRMQATRTDGVMAGDVYLFQGEQVIGLVENLKFQRIKRTVLNNLLPSVNPSVPASTERRASSPQAGPRPQRRRTSKPAVAIEAPPNADSATVDFSNVLSIIATEVGIEVSELDDDVEFAEIGVDSLLTISIVTNLSQMIEMELSASLFIDNPSVGDLRAFFENLGGMSASPSDEKPRRSKSASVSKSKRPTFKSEQSFARVLEVVAAEIGTDVAELEEDANFIEMGVDSLLTISILTNLSQQLSRDLPASLFIDYPSVRDLRSFFEGSEGGNETPEMTRVESSFSSETVSLSGDESYSGWESPTTPMSEYGVMDRLPDKIDPAEMIKKIVAHEVGILPQEIDEDADLVELGVDSLLSLSILTRIKDQMGLVLASTFLIENSTFGDIRRALGGSLQGSLARQTSAGKSLGETRRSSRSHTNKLTASSILLQGSSSSREPCLFLIPDGSGSASSYVGLPPMHLNGPVYGLNSPFLAKPDAFTGPLQEVVSYYIDEIRRIQPQGPYLVGGWSTGGIFAYEAASQLINRYHEEVAKLVLIDAPCPVTYPPLPLATIDFLGTIGVFDRLKPTEKRGSMSATTSGLGMREGVREHFQGSLHALRQYRAATMSQSKCPQTVIVLWANHGVWQTVGEEVKQNTESTMGETNVTTDWIMNMREEYGPGGWEGLLPGTNFICETIEADHFSMMRRPGIIELGAKIGGALAPS